MKNKNAIIKTIILLILLFFCVGFNYSNKLMLMLKNHELFVHQKISSFLSPLSVKGNKIVNIHGEAVILKGVMAPDPARLNQRGLFKRDYYQGISKTGANVIRVPVHPELWINNSDYLLSYLEPIVAWAGELGMYVVIDWHYIGNIITGAGEKMPQLKVAPKELTMRFWKQTAFYFRKTPHVIFEIYNEPAEISEIAWQIEATKIVKEIRKISTQQLILVSGINYSIDLNWIEKNPVREQNLAYVAHIFPDRNHNQATYWDWSFGKIAKNYPIVITEWGFIDPDEKKTKQTYLLGNQALFGAPFLKYLNEKRIGWIAAWYDDEWEAPMFWQGYQKTTNFGKLIFKELALNNSN